MRLTKLLLIVFVGFVFRLLTSCIECNNEPVPFDFSGIEVAPLDNTGTWIKPLEEVKMSRNAVAFEISLFPDEFLSCNDHQNDVSGFQHVSALEECPAKFRPKKKNKKLDVISTFRISETITAGSSVIDSMVAYKNNVSGLSHLYLSIDEIYNLINPDLYYDEPHEEFMVVLKPRVENDSLQFIFKVQFSDGHILTKTTDVIYLY